MNRMPSIDETTPLRAILLIQLGDIGDVIITFPCVRMLRERFPSARILVAVRKKTAALVDICPWADETIAIPQATGSLADSLRQQVAFFRLLRRHRIDLAIDLLTGDRGALLAFLSGARQRIGFYAADGTLWRNRLFTQLYRSPRIPGQHRIDYYRSLLEACGLRTRTPMPEIPVGPSEKANARELLHAEGVPKDRPYMVLQPFSLWPHKEWKLLRFAQLVSWMITTHRLSVLIIGSGDERAGAEAIVARCGHGVYNIAGKTTLDVLPAIFAGAVAFVGIDSSGAHFAAAVDTPTVTLFGPTLSSAWGYTGKRHAIVTKGYTCIPCDRKGCDGSNVSRCLDYLGTEVVIAAVKDHLQPFMAPYQ